MKIEKKKIILSIIPNLNSNKKKFIYKYYCTNLNIADAIILKIKLLKKVIYSKKIKLCQKDNKIKNLIFEKFQKCCITL